MKFIYKPFEQQQKRRRNILILQIPSGYDR